MGIVQFINYLRPIQFIMHVSILNERLKTLDEKIIKLKIQSASRDRGLSFDFLSASTHLFVTIEECRDVFGRIWRLHQSLNFCFGFSLLTITLNAFLCSTFTIYFNILANAQNVTIDFITQPTLHTFHIAALFVVMVYTCETSGSLVKNSFVTLTIC